MTVFEQAQAYVVCNRKLSRSHVLEAGCRANKSIEKQLPANRLCAEGVQLVLLPPLTTQLLTCSRDTRSKRSVSQTKLLLVKASFIYGPSGLIAASGFSEERRLVPDEGGKHGEEEAGAAVGAHPGHARPAAGDRSVHAHHRGLQVEQAEVRLGFWVFFFCLLKCIAHLSYIICL